MVSDALKEARPKVYAQKDAKGGYDKELYDIIGEILYWIDRVKITGTFADPKQLTFAYTYYGGNIAGFYVSEVASFWGGLPEAKPKRSSDGYYYRGNASAFQYFTTVEDNLFRQSLKTQTMTIMHETLHYSGWVHDSRECDIYHNVTYVRKDGILENVPDILEYKSLRAWEAISTSNVYIAFAKKWLVKKP